MVVGEFSQEADVVVIGGGPAGYSAAFRAAELGQSVAIVDARAALGGVCLHQGCIPSKMLLHIAETKTRAISVSHAGVVFDEPRIDLDRMRAAISEAIERLGKGLASTAKGLGVEVFQGQARFDDSRNITIANGNITRVRFKRAIIATGGRPIELPALPFSDEKVWSPWDALALERVPKTLAVVGSNYNAVELATIYQALGSEVTLLCPDDDLLPTADADLKRPLMKVLKASMKAIEMNVALDGLDVGGYERVIVALGHRPSHDGLHLERTDVKCDEAGFITVDEQMRTKDPRIFGVGDVTGGVMLANTAIHQGRVAAEVIAGWNSALDVRAVCHTVYTNPQLAWCGITEQQSKEQRPDVTIAKFRWGGSGRAVGMNEADGMTKLICEPDTGMILGAGFVGPSAVDLVGEAALAIEMGATAEDLAETMHPHPSLCETVRDSAILTGIES